MAKPKDISDLIGVLRGDSRLTIVCRAGYDAARHPLVRVRCLCGEERITRLAHVSSGHTKSHGCLKHETDVQHMQAVTGGLAPATVLVCFVAVCQGRAAELKMKKELVYSAYHRRVAELKELPAQTMQSITLRILRNGSHERIADDFRMHGAEIAWLAKQIVRPAAKMQVEHKSLMNKLKDFAIRDIRSAKADLEEQGRTRFWSSELSGAKNPPKTKLGYAWLWANGVESLIVLTNEESELKNWLLSTAEITFQARKAERRRRFEERKRKTNQMEQPLSSRNTAAVPAPSRPEY